MLSKMELHQYKWGLTKIFVDRVFETSETYDGKMDFKSFVEFILAFENIKEQAATRYFFRIVDVYNKGAIDTFVINMFLKSIVSKLDS
jgi:serine/threonine-protein phosphatase 2A regulatory subunit B''